METLDARGRACPIPLFYVKQRVERIASGSELEVLADDVTARETIPRWCKLHGHAVLDIVEENNHFKIIIRKS
jgi:tRNA 2-thiouridine synthesizing protein A